MRRWRTGLLVGLVACGASAGDDGPRTDAGDSMTGSEVPALVPSLSVSVASDSVRFRLDVTNPGTEPVVIEFPTAERADFAVLDAAGAEVWRASADRMFAQVMGADTVAAGGTRSYEAVWSSGARSGAHVAAARLASTSHDVDLRAEFELPAQ